ncbi:MAG: restriction endonuclease subunit S [Gemmatimonadaceae bacterium]|nr:restriction endonuclease subunit S [Gemmatimonadaceae bacterium]
MPGQAYRQLGVRLWGLGAYEREEIDGGATKYPSFNRIEPNDLVVNKIWARSGAVAVAEEKHARTFVSTEFPTFALDLTRLDPRWMRAVTKWRGFWLACDQMARGTSGKNRIKPAQFLEIVIPLPPLAEQQAHVARLDALAAKTREVEEHLAAVERISSAVLLSLHHRLSRGRMARLGDVLELSELSQPVTPFDSYPQVGVRGFGGGLFPKAAIRGGETSYRTFNRLFTGALVLSQVKGWEGAIARCPAELDGWFVSPEYRTFRCIPELANDEYLGELVRTEWFWSLLQDATRGVGARRERTRPEQFLQIELPLPELEDQLRIVQIVRRQTEAKANLATIRQANAALLPATLERLFAERA